MSGNLSMDSFYKANCILVEALRSKQYVKVEKMLEDLKNIYEEEKKR